MRILLIEDEEAIAKRVVGHLKKEGHAVDAVNDGDKGLRRIALYRDEYDLLILDLMLPGLPGDEVCRKIRELGISIPILILTARDFLDDKVTLLNAGADDYLVKPFSFEELSARIKALSRRPRTAVPVVLTANSLTMNTETGRVFVDHAEIKLTAMEYSLLELFMRNPNKILSRERISEHLWGFDFDSFSNVVDVHIKNVRKKVSLALPNQPSPIETVRGRGYRLNG